MLDIKPLRNKYLNCFAGIVASVASFYGYEYRLMFLNSWGFSYSKNKSNGHTNDKIGEKIRFDWENNFFFLLKQYHGIIIKCHDTPNITDVCKLCEKELNKGLPLAVSFNAYWCPWNKAYQKYSIEHYILIIGIDNEKNFYCIDPYSTDRVEKIHKSDILCGLEKSYSFDFENNQKSIMDWEKIFIDSLMNLKHNASETFQMMEAFSVDLLHLNCEKELDEIKDLYVIPLFNKLKYVEASRFNYANALQYLNEYIQNDTLNNSIKELLNASKMWNELRLILLKYTMVPQQEKLLSNASNKANKIVYYEKSLINNLINIIQSV